MNVRERERDERWGGRVERRRGKGGRTKVRRDRRESIGAECVPEAGVKKTGGEKKVVLQLWKRTSRPSRKEGCAVSSGSQPNVQPVFFCFSFLTSTLS